MTTVLTIIAGLILLALLPAFVRSLWDERRKDDAPTLRIIEARNVVSNSVRYYVEQNQGAVLNRWVVLSIHTTPDDAQETFNRVTANRGLHTRAVILAESYPSAVQSL